MKLFLPSEFGFPTNGMEKTEDLNGDKAKFVEYLKKIELPSALIFVSYVAVIHGVTLLTGN